MLKSMSFNDTLDFECPRHPSKKVNGIVYGAGLFCKNKKYYCFECWRENEMDKSKKKKQQKEEE